MPYGKRPEATVTKTRNWTVPVVLSLGLGVLGALGAIELRPQLAVSPQEELAVGQPFSAPFDVTNTGYLQVHVDNVTALLHKVQSQTGRYDVTDLGWGNIDWDNFDLDRNESKTILLYFTNNQPEKADIIFAVDYRFLGLKRRRLFRFEGIHIEKWDWSKQPLGDLEPDINKAVDTGLKEHYKALERRKRAN